MERALASCNNHKGSKDQEARLCKIIYKLHNLVGFTKNNYLESPSETRTNTHTQTHEHVYTTYD